MFGCGGGVDHCGMRRDTQRYTQGNENKGLLTNDDENDIQSIAGLF